MKNLFISAAVTLLIFGMITTMAFANTPARDNGNGVQLRNLGYAVEDLLQVKLNRIQDLVPDRMDRTKADEFKNLIKNAWRAATIQAPVHMNHCSSYLAV